MAWLICFVEGLSDDLFDLQEKLALYLRL